MSIRWNYRDVMGELTVRDKENKKYKITIYAGLNILAVMNYEYTDEKGNGYSQLWCWMNDKRHAEVQLVNKGCINHTKVYNVKMNLYYRCEDLVRMFTKNGISVKCYFKEPTKQKNEPENFSSRY